MNDDSDPDYLNSRYAQEHGNRPSGAPPQNPVPAATAEQFRQLNGEIQKIRKQIQNIHQKLGGKEGHTITSLSLQNHYNIIEIARLNDAIYHLEQQLHQCAAANEHASQIMQEDNAHINELRDRVKNFQNSDVIKAASEQIKLLKDKLKEAEEKIKNLELRESIHKITLQRQAREECHKISLKF